MRNLPLQFIYFQLVQTRFVVRFFQLQSHDRYFVLHFALLCFEFSLMCPSVRVHVLNLRLQLVNFLLSDLSAFRLVVHGAFFLLVYQLGELFAFVFNL